LKTKVCHISTAHPVQDTRIFEKECQSLKEAGYEVTFIVPNERDEEVRGVNIIALPKARNRAERAVWNGLQAYRKVLAIQAHVYHFHDSELILLGLLLKIRGKRVIYDVHEDYSHALLSREWIPSWLRRLVTQMVTFGEWFGAKFFNVVVAATPHIAAKFPASKTVTVQNFPFVIEMLGNPPMPYQQRKMRAAYVGDLSTLRGIREMIQAISLLPPHWDVKLRLAGVFSPLNLEEEMKNFSGWDRVEFLGLKPYKDVMKMLGEVRMGLVLFHPVPNHIEAQPNKLFEYMSAGIPVIASDFPLWREIVNESGCGLLVNSLDPEKIAQAIQWLLEHPTEAETMGKRGQIAVRDRYNWESESKKLLTLYENILN
jgi:glycosyltransferase involved in cell wall biosynthesis